MPSKPAARKLDAYTLRWIARQAVRAKTAMPMYMDEISFNDALSYVAEKCRKQARALESRTKPKRVAAGKGRRE